MSTIDPSLEPMLEMFIYETTTLLEQLDSIMMTSEKTGQFDLKDINEIFRIMHTIKGSSAMMGMENMAILAHNLEDLFSLFREDPTRISRDYSALFDLLFQSSDELKLSIESVQNGQTVTRDMTDLVKHLEAEIKSIKQEYIHCSPEASPERNATQSDNPELGGFSIRVFFEEGAQMENLRAYMLLNQLKEVVPELESSPNQPEKDSQLSEEIAKNGFLILCRQSPSLECLLPLIESAPSIKSFEVDALASIEGPLDDGSFTQFTESGSQNAQEKEKVATLPETILNKGQKHSLISVNQGKLDHLINIVSEIVTAESMVANSPDLKGLNLEKFNKSTRQLRKLTDELQDIVMSMRMVPLSGLFQKMNRIVRDMSKKLNKQVLLDTIGDDTEVDKSITDLISDPLMHMIRNAVDHAIESEQERLNLGKPLQGRIEISAQNVAGEIVITISDDGRGLNKDKILKKAQSKGLLVKTEEDYSEREIFALIMSPGFSTNDQVTEYSGRGVGMDVVRQNIEKMGGSITIESRLNYGTRFIVKIPLTLAIIDGMEIALGPMILTLPIASIKETFEISELTPVIKDMDQHEMIMVRGECYPLLRLHQLFEVQEAKHNLQEGVMILIENDQKKVCLFADDLIGEQQVVVKPFPPFLSRHNIKDKGLAGCTILGDGSISLILDANSLLNYM